MLAILLASVSMAVKDALSTMLVVAEARGRGMLAGALDAGSDLATILVTLAGAGAVLTHGWTPHTVLLLSAMTVTSFAGTWFWTEFSEKHLSAEPALSDLRLARMEAALTSLRGDPVDRSDTSADE